LPFERNLTHIHVYVNLDENRAYEAEIHASRTAQSLVRLQSVRVLGTEGGESRTVCSDRRDTPCAIVYRVLAHAYSSRRRHNVPNDIRRRHPNSALSDYSFFSDRAPRKQDSYTEVVEIDTAERFATFPCEIFPHGCSQCGLLNGEALSIQLPRSKYPLPGHRNKLMSPYSNRRNEK
jgi:hypothetical protein